MLDFLARNWVLAIVVGGMACMHFGMHRGHGQSGHAGGCGGGGRAQDGHEPDEHPLPSSETAHRSQDRHAEGAEIPLWRVRRTHPAPSDTSVQAGDAAPGERRHRGMVGMGSDTARVLAVYKGAVRATAATRHPSTPIRSR
jgi:hypothetical protein